MTSAERIHATESTHKKLLRFVAHNRYQIAVLSILSGTAAMPLVFASHVIQASSLPVQHMAAPMSKALTCSDLPIVQTEIDQLADFAMHYGLWFIGLAVLGIMKAMDILIAFLNRTGWLCRWIFRAIRDYSRRKAVA